MSAMLGYSSALSHDVNPYIPDLLKPRTLQENNSHHSQSSRFQNQRSARSASLSSTGSTNGITHSSSLLDHHSSPNSHHHHHPQHSDDFVPCPLPFAPPISECAKCQRPILDPFVCRLRDKNWHESCASCAVCDARLSDVCFEHDNQLFCRKDYDRLHAVKCITCAQPMRSHELSMRANYPISSMGTSDRPPLIFHVSCFTCSVCLQPIAARDLYTIDPVTFRPICRADVLASQQQTGSNRRQSEEPLQQQQQQPSVGCADNPVEHSADKSDTSLTSDPSCTAWTARLVDVDGGVSQNQRRMRTSLTDSQRAELQQSYAVNSRPPKQVREGLASKLSVPKRVVQVWFQNQRAREKRAASGHQFHSLQQRKFGHFLLVEGDQHSPAMTPSPRTSEDSGPLPELGGFSADDTTFQPNPLSEQQQQQSAWMMSSDLDKTWSLNPTQPTKTR